MEFLHLLRDGIAGFICSLVIISASYLNPRQVNLKIRKEGDEIRKQHSSAPSNDMIQRVLAAVCIKRCNGFSVSRRAANCV